MRIQRLVLVILSSIFFAVSLNAQQTATPAQRDPQAVLLLQKSLTVLAGTASISDVMLTGTANWIAGSDNESGSATLKATAVGQGRVDLNLSSGQRSEIVDISQAPPTGSWCGPDSVWHSMANHNLMTDPTWFFPRFLIGRVLSTSTYVISPTDAETKDGVGITHMAIYQQAESSTQPDTLIQGLSRIDIYLNSSTLLPVAISFNTHPDDNALANIPTEIKFSNYQTAQGAQVPYHVQKFLNNGLALDLTVGTVQFNTGLSASDFTAQ